MNMDFNSLISLKVLPVSVAKNEEEYLHLPYKEEAKILNSIRKGDINELKKITFLKNIPVGKLSGNSVKQYRYIAICFITLAVRSAISGGMNENEAYSFGDYFIQRIDRINSCEEIINQIRLKIVDPLLKFRQSLNRIKNVSEVTKQVYQFLLDNEIDKKLEPIIQEIEELRKYIREVDVNENNRINLIIASYRFRLVQLC